ncbi:MAG TPA: hypothetical protein VKB93_16920 [Thermoanaerobaculia bacterium]|nr:hypothetical protein [Thermoanaerobaculia bacterium]
MNCPHETNVMHAAAEDRWTESLRAHVSECADCAAAAAAAPWMTRFSRISDREHILPDPSIIWLKAQLMQGTIDAARATRPMTIVQLVGYVIVASGWAGLLTWKWNAVQTWIGSFTPRGFAHAAVRPESLSMSFFAIVFVLASTTVMLALHTILAED